MKYLPLIWAALLRRKLRTILTLLSVVTAFALFGTMMGLNAAFQHFVDLALHDRMAHDGTRAREFIGDLERRTRPAFERENQELQAFAGADKLQPWDVAYYAEKQRLKLYDFDEEALRPYFPLERVLSGMFEIVKRLYGIAVEAASGLPVWHESVRTFQVRDKDGSVLGYFCALFAWYAVQVHQTDLPPEGQPA